MVVQHVEQLPQLTAQFEEVRASVTVSLTDGVLGLSEQQIRRGT